MFKWRKCQNCQRQTHRERKRLRTAYAYFLNWIWVQAHHSNVCLTFSVIHMHVRLRCVFMRANHSRRDAIFISILYCYMHVDNNYYYCVHCVSRAAHFDRSTHLLTTFLLVVACLSFGCRTICTTRTNSTPGIGSFFEPFFPLACNLHRCKWVCLYFSMWMDFHPRAQCKITMSYIYIYIDRVAINVSTHHEHTWMRASYAFLIVSYAPQRGTTTTIFNYISFDFLRLFARNQFSSANFFLLLCYSSFD